MAISIIDPDNGAGTDYLSLSAWVTGEAGDQSGAVCRADCRSSSGSADSAATVSGFTNFSGKVTVQPISESQTHQGEWDGSIYRIASGNNTVLLAGQDDVKFSRLQVENTRTGTTQLSVGVDSLGNDGFVLERCLIKGNNPSTSLAGYGVVSLSNSAINAQISNNIVWGFYGGMTVRSDAGSNAGVAYSNTLVDCGTHGFSFGGGDFIEKSNLVFNCGTAYNNIGGGDQSNSTNNAGDASAANIIGSNSVDISAYAGTAIFADYSGEDFHLHATGAGAADLKGAGADIDADSFLAVTDDIDGDSRDASTPDIGADEYVAAGGGVTIFPAVLNSSHNLDPATLAQESALVPAALGQAHVLDSPALIQAYILSPAELGQSHTISQADLSVAGALSPAELAHSQILDIPSLDQASILTPIDLSHANILDTAGLSEGSFVAPVALFTEHNIDQAIVTAGLFPLRPDGLINANSLDDLQLMQAHILFVDDLLNVQTIDAAALLSGVYYAYGGRIVKLSASGRYLTIDASGRYLKIH